MALELIEAGECVVYEGGQVTALNGMDLGHKIAVKPIAAGSKVIKHQASIGSAIHDIKAGEHIHTHNLKSDYIFGFHREGAGLNE